ncbi:MAG: cupin domain-containing protein [Oscillospiraceae bacterium]|jgi:mannose-6-phosphate isomerase-like protein (cupin superfamily)|nr:cupin domain-containing protein [Oscillospiraceae bacterium]
MPDEMKQVASRLKEIREISDFTADEIAARLHIPPAQYLAYEGNGENIPISVLYALANVYGVDITELLTGASPRLSNYCVVREGQSTGVDRYPGYHFESLAYNFKRRIMEPLMVTVAPGEKEMSPVSHPGQEFNYVVEGAVTVLVDDEEIELKAGECIYFDPTLPHGQKAAGGRPAKFLTVIAE